MKYLALFLLFPLAAIAARSDELAVPASDPNCQLLKENSRLVRKIDQLPFFPEDDAKLKERAPLLKRQRDIQIAYSRQAFASLREEFQRRNELRFKGSADSSQENGWMAAYYVTTKEETVVLEGGGSCVLRKEVNGWRGGFNSIKYSLISLSASCRNGSLKASFAPLYYACDVRELDNELWQEIRPAQ
jgi:hypothetical protein